MLRMRNITKTFNSGTVDERVALDHMDLTLQDGDFVTVIGGNGAGKSTMQNAICGTWQPDEGSIELDGVNVSGMPEYKRARYLGRVYQDPMMGTSAGMEIEENLALAVRRGKRHTLRLGIRRSEREDYRRRLKELGLGLEDRLTTKVGTLSGGQRKRVALAAALIHPADVLILDEPTNHLDAEMTAWLEDWLRRFKGGLVMVTHDRYFLERVVNHITELSRGKLYHYEANYSKYLELKEQRAEMAEASERKRQSILRTEREWIMRGCRARTTKSRDRIERYEALKNQEAPETDDTMQLAAASSRLGKKLIELHDVSKTYESRTVIRDFSYNLLRNDRIGIVGPVSYTHLTLPTILLV